MPRSKKDVEPQKLGGQIYNGTNTLIARVLAWQAANFPQQPPGAPAGQGIYNGLNPQCRIDKVGPGIDAVNPQGPPFNPAGVLDNQTTETRFTWPEAVVAGTAVGWHIQGKSEILDCDEEGNTGLTIDDQPIETPYRTINTSLVTRAQITVLVYRFQNGFGNFCVAGDMQNRFSPFYAPGEELIYSNTGLLSVVGGNPNGSVAVQDPHTFYGKVKSSRKLKVDDTIVTLVRVRTTYDSYFSRPGVVTAVDCTAFYMT